MLTNDSGIVVERGPDTLRGPDLMLIDAQRRVSGLSPRWTESIPALVVEVRSPNDGMDKMTLRVGEYLKHGVPVVWVVDPVLQSLAVYRPDQFPRVLHNSDELLDEDVLPGFRCRVSDLFRMPGEAESAQ